MTAQLSQKQGFCLRGVHFCSFAESLTNTNNDHKMDLKRTPNLTKLVQDNAENKHKNRHQTNAYESDFGQKTTQNSILKVTDPSDVLKSFRVPFRNCLREAPGPPHS